MSVPKSLALIVSGALTAAGCGGDTNVVEHPEPQPAAAPAVETTPPGTETEIETEHPDGSETTTTIKKEVDD